MNFKSFRQFRFWALVIFPSFLICFKSFSQDSPPDFSKPQTITHAKSPWIISLDLAVVHAAGIVGYLVTQPYRIPEMSFKNFRKNVFEMVPFDQDQPFWNIVVHPFAGSQMFLYYRSRGYSHYWSTGLTATSSLLFEFLTETLTEEPALNDMIITPVFGTIVGVLLERGSASLRGSSHRWVRGLGFILNPYVHGFWNPNGRMGLQISYGF